MITRKLQVVGNRSYGLSLPKRWVKKHRLEAGTELLVQESANGDLIIKSNLKEIQKSQDLSISIDNIDHIMELVVFCYVRNVNKLTLLWKKSDLNKIKKIKHALRFLDGYDITKEDENSLEIQFLFTEVTITIPNILRRMVYLLKLMVAYLEQKDHDEIEDMELSLDKLHHLSSRILFSCIRSVALRKENTIMSEEEIYFYRNILKRLESIGDLIYQTDVTFFEQEDVEQLQIIFECLDKTFRKEKIYEMNFATKNIKLETFFGRLEGYIKDMNDNMLDLYYNRLYFSE